MVNPNVLTDPVEPPYAERNIFVRFGAEIWDHLWPWTRTSFNRQRGLQGFLLAVAVAATLAWVIAAFGRLSSAALIGWWLGWSVLEVVVRSGAKPYVKDGPWWGKRYRHATLFDLISYVGFKNLLIGASLFLLLKSFGWLTV